MGEIYSVLGRAGVMKPYENLGLRRQNRFAGLRDFGMLVRI